MWRCLLIYYTAARDSVVTHRSSLDAGDGLWGDRRGYHTGRAGPLHLLRIVGDTHMCALNNHTKHISRWSFSPQPLGWRGHSDWPLWATGSTAGLPAGPETVLGPPLDQRRTQQGGPARVRRIKEPGALLFIGLYGQILDGVAQILPYLLVIRQK